ncbi:MAG: ATP-binding protein, partial [Candidatus Liberibacter asiaticus]
MTDDSIDLFSTLPPQSQGSSEKLKKSGEIPDSPAFANQSASDNYDASSIRILEGLEPVRMRPGMYIGGTDEKALHHLFSEVIDNAMDEVIAGYANLIEVSLDGNGFLTVVDNGRGIPVENH